MSRMRQCLVLGLLVLALLTSCTTPATQLLVVVDSDAPPPGCYGVLVSRITEPNIVEPGATHTYFTAPTTRGPFSFGIAPPSGNFNQRVQVSVEMLRSCAEPSATERIIRRTVRTGFVENRTLRLPIFLSAQCEACDATTTCQERGTSCVPVPDVEASTLSSVVPGEELAMPVELDAGVDAGASADVGASIDAFSMADTNVPDALVDRDAGPPPTCTALSTASYQSILSVPPTTVAPRFTSVGWRVHANSGSSTSHWSTGLSDAPAGGGMLLMDPTGLSSLGALQALASTTLAATDSITVLGSLPASNDVYRWNNTMVASTILSSAGPLRPEGAIAHQGTDVLYTISDSMNRTAILRASMPVPALYTTTEMNRESALASWGGGALVAFGEGATAGRCEVRTISDTDIVGAAIDVPVAGQCAHVAIGDLGMNRAVLVYVASSGGVNEVFAQEINLTTSSLSGAPINLGRARSTLPARPQVWADASGGYRAVWPMDAAVGSALVRSGSVVNRHCITGPAMTNYETVRSARQGATTFVLVQGGGRGGQGLQYATLAD